MKRFNTYIKLIELHLKCTAFAQRSSNSAVMMSRTVAMFRRILKILSSYYRVVGRSDPEGVRFLRQLNFETFMPVNN